MNESQPSARPSSFYFQIVFIFSSFERFQQDDLARRAIPDPPSRLEVLDLRLVFLRSLVLLFSPPPFFLFSFNKLFLSLP